MTESTTAEQVKLLDENILQDIKDIISSASKLIDGILYTLRDNNVISAESVQIATTCIDELVNAVLKILDKIFKVSE
ncbi:hypothetical protein [Xenorhabdus kozodoii]|uniref:Uncharacterized protein n=1 Tax=Xenorhabdus kozodoii TaxID=351676 RepID=A0A2D0LHZ2_9GAMM|nr:hypothetical protein [Xenorhabdus kozodoii]PHM75252.1 hypothetical protein Xkoz_00268 [Xenorhabdus kozodoii]